MSTPLNPHPKSAKASKMGARQSTAGKTEQDRPSTSIDQQGDLRLMLDNGTFTVSRKVLCSSSPVFQAMLGDGSPFLEASAEAVGKNGIREIRLNDDNFDAMETLLRIIHLQYDRTPIKVSFPVLTDIAVLCDKYSLRKCLIPWFLVWSQPHLDSIEKDGFERWLFISVVFRAEDAFTRITRHLILHTGMSSSSTLSVGNGTNISEGVPDQIISQITVRRTKTVTAIQEHCQGLVSRLLHSDWKPVCTLWEKQVERDASNLGRLLQTFPQFRDSGAAADADGAIMSMVSRIKLMPVHWSTLDTYPTYEVDHRKCGLEKLLLPGIMGIIQPVQGLVLSEFIKLG